MTGHSIEKSVRTINGVQREVSRVSFGGRTIEMVDLDMAEQWDFMEVAGRQLDNEPWANTAMLACSVIAIDGLPMPSGVRSRDDIRRILRKLGEDGVDAVQAVLDDRAGAPDAEESRAAMGN